MKLKYYRYHLPFVHSFQTSSNTIKTREGVIIQLQKNGVTVYGEAAPLPGRSEESLSQVIDQLKSHASEIDRLFQDDPTSGSLDNFFQQFDIVPSLCFALDSLACQHAAQRKGVSTAGLLFEKAIDRIPLNAVIPLQSETDTIRATTQARQEGFEAFKLKIGRNFPAELSLLEKIRHQFPDITLRIDANRAWTIEEATHNLNQMQDLDIEYCEEPIRQPTLSALKKLSGISPVPLALDETLTNFAAIRETAPFIPVLILKPMVIGKFSDLFATKRLVNTPEHKVIFTTALESGIGRQMTAILTSGIGSQFTAHGLATGNMLAVDIWRDGSYIQKGHFSLADHPGVPDQEIRSNLKHTAEEIFFPSG